MAERENSKKGSSGESKKTAVVIQAKGGGSRNQSNSSGISQKWTDWRYN